MRASTGSLRQNCIFRKGESFKEVDWDNAESIDALATERGEGG
jgi:hypothetical protein